MPKKTGGYSILIPDDCIRRASRIAAHPSSLLPGEKPNTNAAIRAAMRIGLAQLENGKGIDNAL